MQKNIKICKWCSIINKMHPHYPLHSYLTELIPLLGFLPPLESRLQKGITFWNAVGIISPLF